MKIINQIAILLIWSILFFLMIPLYVYIFDYVLDSSTNLISELIRGGFVFTYALLWHILVYFIEGRSFNKVAILIIIVIPNFIFGTLRIQYFLVAYFPILIHWLKAYLLNYINIITYPSLAVFSLTTVKLLRMGVRKSQIGSKNKNV